MHPFTTDACGGLQLLPPPLNSQPLIGEKAKTYLFLPLHLPSKLLEPLATPATVRPQYPTRAEPTTYPSCCGYRKQENKTNE